MKYLFECKCGLSENREISINDYDKLKDKQTCPKCGNKMIRVIEWEGPANNLGGYSDVAGRASWQ